MDPYSTIDHILPQIWSFIGLFSLLQNLLPSELLQWLKRRVFRFQGLNDKYHELEIPQYIGNDGVSANEVYQDVELYLATLDATEGAQRLTVFRPTETNSPEIVPASGETIQESFNGATVWWCHHARQFASEDTDLNWRCFSLKIERRNKRLVWAYFDHIAKRVAEIRKESSGITIHTNCEGAFEWTGVLFKHPSTFDSLALDSTMKDKIIKDLDFFKKGKEFHNRVGRAWRRGYFLYGPPGTGKSSLVAAIANYMKYDVYDLELTKVRDNFDLLMLLMQIKNASIIVIEDIDCSLDLRDRLSKPPSSDEDESGGRVTLSGVLNFTDGLWSCCGEERIIIFTTNHKDRLDPAMLRSGRMDLHILLSFCSFSQFKFLAFNYLQIEDHPLFCAVEESMRDTGAEMTPAEISEILISHLEDPLKALNAVVSALNDRVKSKSVTDCKEHKETEETTEITEDGVSPGRKKSTQTKAKR